MSTLLVKRPARLSAPETSIEEIELEPPPKQTQQAPAATSASMIIMPMMAGGSVLTMVTQAKDRPLIAAVALLFFIGVLSFAIVMIVGQRTSPRRQLRESRERYLDYVEDLRRRLRTT